MTPTATGEERSALPEPIYSTYPPAYFACDLETTGLDPKADRILEIAWTTLDLHFNQTQPIRRMLVTPSRIARFRLEQNPITAQMHRENGLLDALADPEASTPLSRVIAHVLATTPQREDGKPLVIFGSSVHFDLAFIRERSPRLAERLHYRIADVSSMLTYATAAGIPWPPEEPIAHRAYDDIAWSIKTAQYLRDVARGMRDTIAARVDAWLPDGAPDAPFCRHCGEPVERRANPDTGAADWIHTHGLWGCRGNAVGHFAEVDEKAILASLPPCNCGSIDKNGDDIGEHASTCPYHIAAVRIFGETR